MAGREMANELDRFGKDIDEFNQAYHIIENTYKNMFDQIKSLDSMWEGQTHDAFMTQFGLDAENMEEIIKYIADLSKDLEFAHREYTNCENQVSEIINSMRI